MNPSLLALYGLKWNPFSQELPTEALRLTRQADDFLWRIEHSHVLECGFALIHGDPGTGKSVVLRLLAQRLGRLPDVTVAVHSTTRRATSPTSTGNSASCSRWGSNPTTDGAASRACANAGSPTSRALGYARCC